MRLTPLICLGLMIPLSLSAGDAKSDKVQELDVKKFSFPRRGGSAEKPIVIEKTEDLKLLEGAAGLGDYLKDMVPLGKRTALVFAWAGSGGDRITVGEVKDDTVSLVYTRGLTRDLRQHLRVFTLPKGMKWQIVPGKIK